MAERDLDIMLEGGRGVSLGGEKVGGVGGGRRGMMRWVCERRVCAVRGLFGYRFGVGKGVQE